MKINYYIFLILSGIWFISLSFCKKNQDQDNTAIALLFLSGTNQNQAVINRYAELAYKIYTETYQKVLNLEIAVESYISDPNNQDKLREVRNAWLEARKKYLLTETLRFSDGPVDNPDILSENVQGSGIDLETLINAWPMDEQFNECYLIGSTLIGGSGCTQRNLDEFSLISFNLENDKEENVATGWHPIEYLLWGKDHADAGQESGRGIIQTVSYFTDTTFGPGRRTYLKNATRVLKNHIAALRDQWDPSIPDSYYHEFIKDPETLRKIITGFASFTKNELSAERLNGIDTRDQEDEHSCFSDTTNYDFYYNLLGIKIFYTGDYNGEDGPGLDEISLSYKDHILEKINSSMEVFNPDTAPVYDVVIVANANGRTNTHDEQYNKIKFDVRPDLADIGLRFVDIGKALGFTIIPRIP